MTRIALIEVTFTELGADYKVHAQLVASARESRDLEVMSICNPVIVDLETKGIERRAVKLAEPGRNRVVRRLLTARNLPRAVRDSVRLVREFAPDVIYSSQQRRDVLLARIVSRVTRTPLIVHLHYQYGPWLGRVAAASIRRAAHVIAVSEFVRETTILRGLKDDQVSTIHNVTAPRPDLRVDRARARGELGIDPGTPVIAAVGRLDPSKGIQSLIQVLPPLLTDAPDLRVLVCGRSVHHPGFDQELERLTTSLGLDPHVTFLGHRDDVPTILQAADIFCLPSTLEAFGLVFIEAMRAGLPVVALRSGGVPEIVADGITGLLSYPRDLAGLERNLRRLLVDRDLATAMGEAGQARLDEVFGAHDIANRWLSLVESVIARA